MRERKGEGKERKVGWGRAKEKMEKDIGEQRGKGKRKQRNYKARKHSEKRENQEKKVAP